MPAVTWLAESVQWGASAPMFFDGAVLDAAPELGKRFLENSTRDAR